MAGTPGAPKGASGLGIASLCLGIVGAIIAMIPCIGFWPGVGLGTVGLILGGVGLATAGETKGKGLPIAGVILSIISITVAVAWFYLFVAAVNTGVNAVGAGFDKLDKATKDLAEKSKKEVEDGLKTADTVSAADLLKAYNEDVAKADTKYKGKFLKVKGKIDKINKGNLTLFPIHPVITLKGGEGKGDLKEIECEIILLDFDAVGALKEGDEVTIGGKCAGKVLGSVSLKPASVIK